MLENKEYFAPFKAKGIRDMYELKITYVNAKQEATEIIEIVDAYPGEVGRRYASNLLFRMGNEMVKGTELENSPWKKAPMEGEVEGKVFGFLKRAKDRSRLYTKITFVENKTKTEDMYKYLPDLHFPELEDWDMP